MARRTLSRVAGVTLSGWLSACETVQFFFIWNDLLIALTFTNDTDLRTIQVGLLNFTGEFSQTEYGPLFAAICINVFGTLVLYLFLNQKVMKGLTSGAVKG